MPNVVYLDSANYRFQTAAGSPALTASLSFAAILPVPKPTVKCHCHRRLLDAATCSIVFGRGAKGWEFRG